jgi:hypothetical protein
MARAIRVGAAQCRQANHHSVEGGDQADGVRLGMIPD